MTVISHRHFISTYFVPPVPSELGHHRNLIGSLKTSISHGWNKELHLHEALAVRSDMQTPKQNGTVQNSLRPLQ